MTMPAAALKSVGRGFSGQHPGIDLVAPYGSPVRSAAAGTVIYAGSYSNYGNMVDVLHRNGVVTRYAHLSSFAPGVHRGGGVRTGSLLGTVGATGNATGAHLHFEVRINDRAVDPKPALAMAACHRLPTTREPIEVARASTTHWVGWTRWGSPRGSAR
jgi:murein DD-endopeptidase MepM/ murein hydrolase activator NlpD